MSNLIGIPFIDGGRDPKIGVDCWGLFILAMKEYGHDIPDYKVLAFDTQRIDEMVSSNIGLWKKCEKPNKGLAVSLSINPKYPNVTQHFGVCLSPYTFLHTRQKTGSVIERLDHIYWSNKITGFWQWQE